MPKKASDLARLLAVVLLWAALFRVLSLYGVDLLPRAWARELTLEAYLALVQVVTAACGLGLAAATLAKPREDLALVAPERVAVARALALAPAVFVLAAGVAFQIAKPTLLEELARGGAALVRKNAGEFGREMTQSPVVLAFAWGAVVSPLAEELFFRGALFTLVARLVRAPSIAVVAVAVAFGLLHRDMPGGMGIVRFVSALGLGLACGVARQGSGSVVPAMIVHVVFNTLSLAAARRLIVFAAFPVKSAVPTALLPIAALGIFAVLVEHAVRRRG